MREGRWEGGILDLLYSNRGIELDRMGSSAMGVYFLGFRNGVGALGGKYALDRLV